MQMKARLRFILPVLVLVSATAFSNDKGTERRELRLNRAKWEHHGINSYEFRLRDENCYCLYGPYYGPIRVIVKNGRVRKAIYEGERRDGFWFGREVREKTDLIATVDEVFSRAEHLITSVSDRPYKIRYNSVYGFPVLIDVDNPPGWADGQWRLVVDGFRPTKR